MNNLIYKHKIVVIGVPVYNEEKYIEETLRSIQKQSLGDFLVIVSDNASTDGTSEICKRFCSEDNRFFYIRQAENIGAARNFNYLLDQSDSKYFMWLGAHDLIHPKFLSGHIKFLDRNIEYVLSYTHTQGIDENGGVLSVTSSGGYSQFNYLSPWKRYLQVMKLGVECTPINHIIRRTALIGLNLKPVRSCDRILLSRLFYIGLFNCISEPLYYARKFSDRGKFSPSYIIRITGDSGTRIKNYEFYKAWFFDAMDLESSIFWRLKVLPGFLWQLDKTYRIGPNRLYSFIIKIPNIFKTYVRNLIPAKMKVILKRVIFRKRILANKLKIKEGEKK